MSLRSRYHINTSMFLTKVDYYHRAREKLISFMIIIHNYIISIITSIYIFIYLHYSITYY